MNIQERSGKISHAALQILTARIEPETLTMALGIKPTRQHIKGARRSKRNPKSGIYDANIWIFESTLPETAPLHQHIDDVLKVLEAHPV